MSFFKLKTKSREVRVDGRIDLRSAQMKRSIFAQERVKKVMAGRVARFVKTVVVVFVCIVIGVGVFGFIGILAYSLKSGKELSLSDRVNGFLSSTPLKFLVKNSDTKIEILEVVGVSSVVEFPESSFVFENYITRIGATSFAIKADTLSAGDSQSLYDFLTSGQSVYRLPLSAGWVDVQEYYKKELVKSGWQFQASVAITDTEKIPGEYYTKDEKGLHIYSVADDLWFETVTKVQAEQGLHDKIVAYKAKQELVAAASGQDLPNDAVWKLRYSRDWSVELQKNTIYGENNVYFTHDTSKERVVISVLKRYPGVLADLTYKGLEAVGVEYISTWLTTQQTSVTLQGFTRKELIVADGKALEFSDVKNRAYFLFLVNKKNKLYYVVQYFGKENPEFFEYIKDNLKN
ncbi:hypothetical protein IT418_01425 [bacterium]|nr:hypothetical protein [bacterium]